VSVTAAGAGVALDAGFDAVGAVEFVGAGVFAAGGGVVPRCGEAGEGEGLGAGVWAIRRTGIRIESNRIRKG